MTSENLEIIKNMAIQLLYLDAIPTCTIGGIQQVSHPVFDENPMVWRDGDKQFQTADILTDRKGIKKARARPCSLILIGKKVYLTVPLPFITYLTEVSSLRAMGPRTWSF